MQVKKIIYIYLFIYILNGKITLRGLVIQTTFG